MICAVLDVASRGRAGTGARARARAAPLDVDVRIVASVRRAAARADVVSVGPTVEWESNGSIAPIAPGRATARRTAEALRTLEPDVVHLHEPLVPGPDRRPR